MKKYCTLLLTSFLIWVGLNAHAQLYTFAKDGFGVNKLATLNPASGIPSVIPFSSLGASFFNIVDYPIISDGNNRMYYFDLNASLTKFFRAADLSTGTITSSFAIPNGQELIKMAYDCQRDSIYAIRINNATGLHELVRFSEQNPTLVPITSIPNHQYSASDQAVIDPINGTYHYFSWAGSVRFIHTVELATATHSQQAITLNNMTFTGSSGSITQLNYNCLNQNFYAIYRESFGNNRLVTVDPITGNCATLPGNWANLFTIVTTKATINPFTNELYQMMINGNGTYFLFTIDLATGGPVANSVLQTSNNITDFQYTTHNNPCSESIDSTTISNTCIGDTTTFETPNSSGFLTWDFGDLTSPTNTDTGSSVSHVFSDTGTYNVRLIAKGCLSSDTAFYTVTVNPLPDLQNTSDTLLCQGDTLFLFPADTFSTYSWSGLPPTDSFAISAPGEYNVLATRQNCIQVDTFSVNFISPPFVDLGTDTLICSDSSFTLSAENPGGSYTWNTSDTTQTITDSTAGIYTVTVSNGVCIEIDSFEVNYSPLLAILPDTFLACLNTPITLSPFQGAQAYLWNSGDTTSTLSTVNSGAFTVSLTYQGCTLTDSSWVSRPERPYAIPDTIFCENDSLILTLPSIYQAPLWNGTVSSYQFAVTSVGTNTLNYSSSGCDYADTFMVSTVPAPNWLDETRVLCDSDSLLLFPAIQPDSGSWVLTNTDTLNIATPGSYIYTGYAQGCSFNDTTVVLPFTLNLQAIDSTWKTCSSDSVTLNPQVGSSFLSWGDGDSSQVKHVSVPGSYTYSYGGCGQLYNSTINLELIETNPEVYVPNAFSPNGDNINDRFEVVYDSKAIANLELQIFNRWGSLVYEGNDEIQWNGLSQSNSNLFPYIMRYKSYCDSNKEIMKKGVIFQKTD